MIRPYQQEKKKNEEVLLQEIKEKKATLSAYPPRCTFEHSWRCNYNCKKCGYSRLSRGPNFSAINAPEWDSKDLYRIADELFPAMRYVESTLLGEPFLSPQFSTVMELCRKYGVYYRPTTNGSLLTEEKLPMINGVVDWLKCSFDAHNEVLYKKLYLNDNFSTVVRNLKRFSEARENMDPYPWFRVGLVLMRSNLPYLKEYADFVFNELKVDDMEIMALNFANNEMTDEFYWDIPEEVNRAIDDLIEHCIKNKYRLRLAFTRMPRQDGTWIGGVTSKMRSREIAANQPKADNIPHHPYSEDVLKGDIFGNREQMEEGYIWTNDMRISSIQANDGSTIGVCEFFTRPFLKPPTKEKSGEDWIKYESCGSCSTYVFGNLKKCSFKDLYNNSMVQEVRKFLYNKYSINRENWMVPCKNCLCIDQVYSFESNGQPNVGKRYFPGDNLYKTIKPSVLSKILSKLS